MLCWIIVFAKEKKNSRRVNVVCLDQSIHFFETLAKYLKSGGAGIF